ncbi:MAG: hypothetical protein RLZZ387_4271 [Chloroflexota bacterium]|jgi:rRNA-processing protein FCF1
MVDSPLRHVIDTNILIDLHTGGILRQFFSFAQVVLAPDVIIAELREPSRETLIGLGIREVEFSGQEVAEVFALHGRYRRVSVNDLFALTLARREAVDLLTGDRHLRMAAEQEGVRVRGALWVLDGLVAQQHIPPLLAASALQLMLDQGRRLPAEKCDARLRLWRGKREND